MNKLSIDQEETLMMALTPPSGYQALANNLTTEQRGELVDELEQIAIAAGTLAMYLEERYGYGCGDQGHTKAVKLMNRCRRAIRKAFGYTTTIDLDI